MFDAVGRTVVVDEKNMDAVTGLSASGPAFAYIILESLAEAGVKVGLPRDVATLLAAQTMKGAASVVLETGDHPALLKDAVTTPAGCTIDGILELEDGKLRVTLIKAVVKARAAPANCCLKNSRVPERKNRITRNFSAVAQSAAPSHGGLKLRFSSRLSFRAKSRNLSCMIAKGL